MSIGQVAFLEQTKEVTMTWWWWPFEFVWRRLKTNPFKTEVWHLEAKKLRCGRHISSNNRLEMCTTHDEIEIDSMITTYNTAATETAREILGKECRRKKPLVTRDVLDLCDSRRNLKKRRYEEERVKEYRKAKIRVAKALKKAKEDWIDTKCEEIDACLTKSRKEILRNWLN